MTCIAVMFSVGRANADFVLDFTGGNVSFAGDYQTLGWEFTLSENKTMTALGVWDEFGDGLAEDHLVGIWQVSGGAPLAVTTVTNSSSPFASTENSGRWLFQDLPSPLILTPGRYVIGANYDGDVGDDPVRIFTDSLSLAPGFFFNQNRFTTNPMTGLDFPDSGGSARGFFGPNLMLGEAVPEPSSILLSLAALGLTGIQRTFRARRQKKIIK
jgi:hypothetical protein